MTSCGSGNGRDGRFAGRPVFLRRSAGKDADRRRGRGGRTVDEIEAAGAADARSLTRLASWAGTCGWKKNGREFLTSAKNGKETTLTRENGMADPSVREATVAALVNLTRGVPDGLKVGLVAMFPGRALCVAAKVTGPSVDAQYSESPPDGVAPVGKAVAAAALTMMGCDAYCACVEVEPGRFEMLLGDDSKLTDEEERVGDLLYAPRPLPERELSLKADLGAGFYAEATTRTREGIRVAEGWLCRDDAKALVCATVLKDGNDVAAAEAMLEAAADLRTNGQALMRLLEPDEALDVRGGSLVLLRKVGK